MFDTHVCLPGCSIAIYCMQYLSMLLQWGNDMCSCWQLFARRCVWLYIVKDIMMSLSGLHFICSPTSCYQYSLDSRSLALYRLCNRNFDLAFILFCVLDKSETNFVIKTVCVVVKYWILVLYHIQAKVRRCIAMSCCHYTTVRIIVSHSRLIKCLSDLSRGKSSL